MRRFLERFQRRASPTPDDDLAEPIESGYDEVDLNEQYDPNYQPTEYMPPGLVEEIYQATRVDLELAWSAAENAYENHLREHVEAAAEVMLENARNAAMAAATQAGVGLKLAYGTISQAITEQFRRTRLGYQLHQRLEQYHLDRLKQAQLINDQTRAGVARYQMKNQAFARNNSPINLLNSSRASQLPRRTSPLLLTKGGEGTFIGPWALSLDPELPGIQHRGFDEIPLRANFDLRNLPRPEFFSRNSSISSDDVHDGEVGFETINDSKSETASDSDQEDEYISEAESTNPGIKPLDNAAHFNPGSTTSILFGFDLLSPETEASHQIPVDIEKTKS